MSDPSARLLMARAKAARDIAIDARGQLRVATGKMLVYPNSIIRFIDMIIDYLDGKYDVHPDEEFLCERGEG